MKGTEDDGELTTAIAIVLRMQTPQSPDMLTARSDWRTPHCQADKVQGLYKKCAEKWLARTYFGCESGTRGTLMESAYIPSLR